MLCTDDIVGITRQQLIDRLDKRASISWFTPQTALEIKTRSEVYGTLT